MKKFFPFAILGCLVSLNAFAACGPHQDCPSENDRLNVHGVGCYTCHTKANGGCGDGYLLAVVGNANIKGSGGNTSGGTLTDYVFRCSAGGAMYDDHWRAEKKIPTCSHNPLAGAANTQKVLYDPALGSSAVTGGAAPLVGGAVAGQVCFKSECKVGYVTTADGTKCEKACMVSGVPYKPGYVFGAKVDCAPMANTKSGKLCKSVCATGGNLVTRVTPEACIDGYVPNADETGCVKGAALIDAERRATSNKQKCEASFGTWSGGKCVCDTAKNLIQDTNVTCKCKDANYERNNSTKSCELTKVAIREQACKAAASSGASWNGTKCVCNDSKKEWTGAKCEYPVGYVQCQAVAGATWDAVSKQCVCNDETKVFDGTKCVETEEAKQKRIYGAATKSISSAVGKLDSFVDGLEVSKWKDEEGEFNTARLASDSIAGVVLGTAGGLITSSVVKKHQVEEGFEDLNCTIGGQTVAGWGDEFRVGVQ